MAAAAAAAAVGSPPRLAGESSLDNDVLEEIISHVSPLDLVPASRVSRSWRRAVSASLRRSPRRRLPWLILHLQRPSSPIYALAFDPHSLSWLSLPRPLTASSAFLRSSHPSLLTALTPSALALSTDAFGAAWRLLPPPRVSRADAVVALVGTHLVVAGGAVGYYDDDGGPRSVEAYRVDDSGGPWEACEPMPDALRCSAAATWLSVAASATVLYVLEKRSSLLCSFYPETKLWGPVRQLLLDPAVFLAAVAVAGGDRVVVAGAAGAAAAVESITIWEAGGGDAGEVREIGRMPAELVEKVVGERWGLSSAIGFSVVGDYGYVYNPADPAAEVVLCEFGEGGCRWVGVGGIAGDVNHDCSMVFRCASVGMEDLKRVSSPAAASVKA